MVRTNTYLADFNGGSSAIYEAEAAAVQPKATLPVSAVSKANPAAFTSAAHGLGSDNRVTISGATGDWAALNGDQIVTATDANTFTVAVNSSAFNGSFNGTVSTTAPRSSAACWKLTKNYYDGNGNLIRGAAAAGGSQSQIYDNRASVAYN